MKKYWLLLQEQPTSRLLLFSLPLLLVGVALVVIGFQATQQGQPAPIPTGTPEQQSLQAAPVSTPTALPDNPIRLAWFYKPPEEGEMGVVAENFDFFVLTYKDESARDQLKSLGVDTPFAQYLLFLVINDPGDCEESPPGNQAAFKPGDFCMISEQHPDWFLLDRNGERIRGNEETYYMDPGNEGFRQFWLERARELQETHGWDHIFLDNVEASRTKLVQETVEPAKYPDDASYTRAVEGFLTYIRQSYFEPQGRKIYGNIVSVDDEQVLSRYIALLDGVMIESFATDWEGDSRSQEDWEEQMAMAESILRQGKTLILVAQGEQDNQEMLDFSFASYLLITDGNAVFRYTEDDSYREVWLYDEYQVDLGSPLGPRYLERGVWRRDFSSGHVTVDPQKHAAAIVVDP